MTKPNAQGRIVLIADDVAGIRTLTKAILTSDDTTVLQASNGEEAIAVALDRSPDLILLDLAMPGMDGIAILRHLRSMPETQDIPIVIVTALAHSEMAVQAAALGANDLIEKPFRPAELRRIVDRWAA